MRTKAPASGGAELALPRPRRHPVPGCREPHVPANSKPELQLVPGNHIRFEQITTLDRVRQPQLEKRVTMMWIIGGEWLYPSKLIPAFSIGEENHTALYLGTHLTYFHNMGVFGRKTTRRYILGHISTTWGVWESSTPSNLTPLHLFFVQTHHSGPLHSTKYQLHSTKNLELLKRCSTKMWSWCSWGILPTCH